ncbi:DUF3327 domain-containing protein [Microbacterium sp. KUDC0406]|uniref:alpha/beta hydrolase n=1 Tax=Microbacterium sp. KUDC0406 TaxID=2909588 RepID=UPI001F00A225|nr:enterochelin esterase domain-containing protein [Microbacterium sp. KUDC0406]UJP10906.1 DUF3327 domain-containing protein [Microbacterium sp. KUDC0406]
MSASAPVRRPETPGADIPVRVWTDRRGRDHQEKRPSRHRAEPQMRRIRGPVERAWARAEERDSIASEVLARPNPLIEQDPDDPQSALWTWVVEAPSARAVVLWTNPVFDHADVSTAELIRLPDSDLWTICLRLPSALRASYRIGVWNDEATPPWHRGGSRRDVIVAAIDAGDVDARGSDVVPGSRGRSASVGSGPTAPAELWRGGLTRTPRASRTDELALPGDERCWVYEPAATSAQTPLLVLFDGGVWRRMLPEILDAAIGRRILPPLHVAMLDEQSTERRWQHLGVPAAQVDVTIDRLLPRIRSERAVQPHGAATIVSGQSLGGIAALWTLALSGGEVHHAIAQSPSLWRFDVAEHLLAEPGWRSAELQAGTFEGDMLADAAALAAHLQADRRIGDRSVLLSPFEAGHDWAAWRANLVGSLAALLPTL